MKLEVGKKYVTREDIDVKYVRIDAIRPEFKGTSAACATAFTKDGDVHSLSYNEDGSFRSLPNSHDLVAEYKEHSLCITEKDVGRKVRFRDGTIAIITSFHPDCDLYPVVCISRSFSTKGRSSFRGDGDGDGDGDYGDYNIIEFID